MFETFRNAWKIADLRKKIFFTFLIILIFRIGAAIPVPFVNIVENGIQTSGGTMMSYLSVMTGGAFNYGTLFAMSVTPYINASIIMQLLTIAIPPLERLSKEGDEGRKKIASITRYAAVILGLLQSTAYFFYLKHQGYLKFPSGGEMVFSAFVIIAVLTAGTALMMWLGEQINQNGIGNGISILLFAGIVSRGPSAVLLLYNQYWVKGGKYYALVPMVLVIFLVVVGFVVWMDSAERRIPVQYAKRVVGRKVYGGQSTHIPIKVNMSGVMPIIFASSILALPTTIEMIIGKQEEGFWGGFFKLFTADNLWYALIYFLLILFFAYFYAAIQYNPVEMANNIRKSSGAIPGIRPGKPTSDYISKIMNRIVLLGALCLSVVAVLPILFSAIAKMNVSLGGTSLLILVGVALETVRQIESQMMMRHYKGFLE